MNHTTLLQGMNMPEQIRTCIFKRLSTSSLIVSQSLYNRVPSCCKGLTSMFFSSSGLYVRWLLVQIKQRKFTEFLNNQWCKLLIFLVVVNTLSCCSALEFFVCFLLQGLLGYFKDVSSLFFIIRICIVSCPFFLSPLYGLIYFAIFKVYSFGNIRLHLKEGHVDKTKIIVCAVSLNCLHTCAQPFYIFLMVTLFKDLLTWFNFCYRIHWPPKSFSW